MFRRPSFVALIVLVMVSAAPALAKSHGDVAAAIQGSNFQLTFTVEPGLHAQSHTPLDPHLIALTVTMQPADGVTFDEPIYPPAEIKVYPLLGKLSVYSGKIKINVPFHRAGNGALPPMQGELRFQACNDSACFPPQKLPFSIGSPASSQPATKPVVKSVALVTPHIFGRDLSHDAYGLAFIGAFVVGIIFNIMPCVLPVVPLKIMGFYEVSQHNRAKSLALGAVFSAGLIASFVVLGILIAALHVIDWGGLFKQTWFTTVVVAVLVAMSCSLIGFFTVGLPTGIYRFTPRHDTYGGNFLFGILTAVLSTPCTIGMFVGLLTWTLSQPAAIGTLLITTVGIGMASPYFVLSAFPQLARNFPRTGAWADVVKQMMGFLLLATAVYFAQPLLSRFVTDAAFWWAMFAVIAGGGAFLCVRSFQISEEAAPRLTATSIAVIAIGVALWGAIALTSRPYEWLPFSDDALSKARASGRPVLVDFTASWCGNCHYLEAFVLKNSRIVSAIRDQNVTMMKADVSDDSAPGAPLLHQLNPADSIPLTAIYLPSTDEPKTLSDIYSVNDLLRALK